MSSLSAASTVLSGPRIGRPALIFGATGAPMAWFGQRVFGEAVIRYACMAGARGDVLMSGPAWATSALVSIESMAFLIAVAAGLVSFWAITFGADAFGRHDRQTVAASDVRRVLALTGLMMAGCFTTIIAFDALFLVTTAICTY